VKLALVIAAMVVFFGGMALLSAGGPELPPQTTEPVPTPSVFVEPTPIHLPIPDPPARARRYESMEEILAAIEARGLPGCATFKPLRPITHPGLVDQALCGFQEYSVQNFEVFIFDSAARRRSWLPSFPENTVYGPNWIISAHTRHRAKVIQGALGGKL